jgi:hypothetical protein
MSAETDMSTVSVVFEKWPAMLAIGSIATETATIRVRIV